MNRNSSLSYRPEIDGLRAIAVGFVILYHAQFHFLGRDWFEGGFIGVDIFFVISGYLITRIILSELKQRGAFNFIHFYERRVRRLFPMLFVMVFVSLPFAYFYLLPSDLVDYAESLLSTIIFGSNFYFYFSNSEYGTQSSLLKPLFHTWSLAIEEQYYLVFPGLAVAVYRFGKRHILKLVGVLSLVSLVYAYFTEVNNPTLNFLSPLSRYWEFGVGSVLAAWELNNPKYQRKRVGRYLPLLGLVLIVYSTLSFDAETPHPSFHTLIPVLGVAFIIAFCSSKETVGKYLGCKPLVSIGLVSYSAYLWHFPIFAFGRMSILPFTDEAKCILIFLVFLFSFFSYRWVETPFRRRGSRSYNRLKSSFSLSLVVILFVSALAISNDGLKGRFRSIEGLLEYQIDNGELREKSWAFTHETMNNKAYFSKPGIKVLVVGNSHGENLFQALYQNKALFQGYHFAFHRVQVACFDERDPHSVIERKKLYSSKEFEKSSLIVISSRYNSDRGCWLDRRKKFFSGDFEGIGYLIDRAQDNGKAVIVLGRNVEFPYVNGMSIADYQYSKLIEQGPADARKIRRFLELSNSMFFERQTTKQIELNKKIKAIASERGVEYFDNYESICEKEAGKCYAFTKEGYKTMYNDNHFTLEGARFLGERMYQRDFEKTMRAAMARNTASH